MGCQESRGNGGDFRAGRVMRAFLVDVENGTAGEVQAAGLADYYRLLNCESIAIPSFLIGGKEYDVIADDEGIKEGAKVSAICRGKPALVGNLLIMNQGNEGTEAPLHDLDCERIRQRLRRAVYADGTAALILELDDENKTF